MWQTCIRTQNKQPKIDGMCFAVKFHRIREVRVPCALGIIYSKGWSGDDIPHLLRERNMALHSFVVTNVALINVFRFSWWLFSS